eukprot:TRINITY_DN5227_c0_g1_i3.p1 TRINITY_DN5227_c0_g1~~TRINITY_DN5227_c0_g1_i3.p1  ORF type:complete len:140 (-),score=38.79 TRINITY_DN5227_c0_g1_i3:82-501(-)
MIISKDFNASQFARDAEFTTNKEDRPLIVQFAANDAFELASASEKVIKYCDGIDINCGCPQRWVMSEGYGSALLNHPELIADMVRQTKMITNGIPVSIKIRIDAKDKQYVTPNSQLFLELIFNLIFNLNSLLSFKNFST